MLKKILIIFGYILSALAIAVFTAALVAYGNDYTYDFSTQKVIQKGHVIIDSTPSGVKINEDGKLLNKKTPYQAAVKVGDHHYKLEKDGFWPWEKVLHVVAGQVALASYVIFVPKDIPDSVFDSRGQIVAQAISKDHRHLAYITDGPDAGLYTLDLGNKKIVKQYVPKAATPTTPVEVLKDVAWSDDASHLLITSDMGGTPEFRLAAAGGGDPVDLTQVYGFNLTGLKFSGSNWRQLYWSTPDGLRRLDVDANTVSGVLADKVKQFWVQPDRVLYVQQTDLGPSLWSLDSRGKKQELIQALVESDSYTVAQSRYNGEDELVVVPSKTGIATLYSGIYGDTPVAKVIAKDVTGATFSPDAHLLALTSDKAITMYDLEHSALEQTMVTYAVKYPEGGLSSMTWFDSYHILTTRAGQLYWSEYDGANALSLGKAAGALPGYSDADSKAVIMFRAATNAIEITNLQIR